MEKIPSDMNLNSWFEQEIVTLTNPWLTTICRVCYKHLDPMIHWSKNPILLWNGCVRIPYHKIPPLLKQALKAATVKMDSRSNGPAIMAYNFGGGIRPPRSNGKHLWSVHHIYQGKYPYPGKKASLHAVRNGQHFTQSAGLVAIHPVADALCEEVEAFSWVVRARAYIKFGYDPDCVFSPKVNQFGFGSGRSCAVIHPRVSKVKPSPRPSAKK